MSIPSYLNQSFRYLKLTGVTNTANILANIGSELSALGWTDQGSNKWKINSADGRISYAQFTSPAANILQVQMFNQNNSTCGSKRANINTNGATVNIYSTPYSFIIDCWYEPTQSAETVMGGIFSLVPFPLGLAVYTYVHGFRNDAGTATDNSYVYLMTRNGSTPYSSTTANAPHQDANVFPGQTRSGRYLYYPIEHCVKDSLGGTLYYGGRLYNVIALGLNFRVFNSPVQVPIDEGEVLGTFMPVFGLSTNNCSWVIMVRIA